jgi:homocysteine S-methyltransferase
VVETVHRDYLVAGAELIETNTFGCNEVRLAPHELSDKVRLIARQGVKVARGAREIVGVNAFVAGSIGPLGKPLEPFGHISVAEAERYFRATVEGLLEGGCDCLILETFQDLNEVAGRAARRAPRDARPADHRADDLRQDGKTLYGHTPTLAVKALKQAGRRRGGRRTAASAAGRRSKCWRRCWPPPTARRSPRCRTRGCRSSSRAASSTSRARVLR